MIAPRDPGTRATRLAANAAAVAVVAWAILYFVTTQLATVRAASPFGEDPWDAVVSYAAIFLPIVVGATWLRSLRHRGPQLEPATGRRIRIGAGIALAIIGVNVVSDAAALLAVRLPEPAAASDGRLALMIGLVSLTGALTLAATAFLLRAVRCSPSPDPTSGEPDLLDDLLGLASEVAGHVGPIRSPATRVVAAADRFLLNSRLSPRRHRLIFGLLVAVVAGLAFDAWRSIVEGPAASLFALALFASLAGGGVLVIYLATLGPLRLIRRVG